MKRFSTTLIAAVVAVMSVNAQAQTYPTKPIKLIVSIAAGSVTDVIMRAAATELQTKMGQPLIIENRGGAAGVLGAQTCAQAMPDGYNICCPEIVIT